MADGQSVDDYLARVRDKELTSISSDTSWTLKDVARLGETLYETRMTSTVVEMDIHLQYLMASAPLSAHHEQQEQGTSLRTLRHGVYYPMIEYLRTTPKLTRFTLDCWDENASPARWSWTEACDLACQLIPEALYSNQSITDLSLDYFDSHLPESFPLRGAILTALARRRRQLDKLCLYSSNGELSESTEFAAYLQSCALNELKLSNMFYISEELCNLLFVAHRGRIKRIVFDRCDVAPEAARPLASCLEQQNACNTNNDNDKTMLDLFVCCEDPDHVVDSQALGAFFIPSQGFVRVYELDMSLGAFRHLPVLTFHLPASLHVRLLRLRLVESMDESDDEGDDEQEGFGTPAQMFHVFGTPAQMFHNNPNLRRRQLLDSIRRNGSVQTAEVMEVRGHNQYENFFTPAQERIVQACMTRNKELPRLLSRPRVDTMGNNNDHEGTTELELFRLSLSLVPRPPPWHPTTSCLA